MVNNVYQTRLTPLDEEFTTWFPASNLRLGLEYRHITPESVQRARDRNPGQDLNLTPQEGWSLHVFGADDGHEYMRFDCFPQDPHYHYVHPGAVDGITTHQVFVFDTAADESLWEWTKQRLVTRLPQMLRQAKGGHLVDKLDIASVDRALKAVDDKIRSIQGQRGPAPEQAVAMSTPSAGR